MFKGIDLLTLPLTLWYMTNYFLNMGIKLEVYFYNLKKFGTVDICGLNTICSQIRAPFNFSAIISKIGLEEE